MEEDDPVVQEIPVYLSQALAENFYIFQYPVRPSNRDWKDVNVKYASIKPKNQIVRIEVGLDTYSEKYCPSKGEQIALNTDGHQEPRYMKERERDKSRYFRNGIMDKIVYESSVPACLKTEHFAVALLQDKEIHCTPVKGIIQLRPSYSYYDKQDKRKNDKNKTENTDDEDKEPEPQQVTVKFARQETEMSKKAHEKSYDTISQRIAEEPWYDGLWSNSESDYAELERLKLFSASTLDGSSLTLPPREYIRALVPSPEEADFVPPKTPTLQEQIKEILISSKLMTFGELRVRLKGEGGAGAAGEGAILTALGGAACCVRGLWTPRSVDLYTRAKPAPVHLMCAARDHVLYLFTQHSYVDRRKVAAAVRLPPSDVLDIISSVAKFNPKTGWELLLPPDTAFEARYPDIVQRQNVYWEARQRQFNEMLIGENVTKRQRKKSQRESISSDSILSPKPRCNSVSEEDNERKRPKNKSATGVGKRTRKISSSGVQDAT